MKRAPPTVVTGVIGSDIHIVILDPGVVPFPAEVLELHERRLRRRAEGEKLPYGPELTVATVYDMAEPVAELPPDAWTV